MPTKPVIIDGVMSVDGAAAVPVHIDGTATWDEEAPPVIEPEPPPTHAYFDALAARPEATYINASESAPSLHAWSLRDAAQITAVTSKPPNLFWSYDYAGDDYPLKQDAAKLLLDPADLPEGHPDADFPRDAVLFFPVGILQSSTDTILITWDHYYGTDWLENIGECGTWKHYNLYAGNGLKDRNTYIGPKVYWNRADETYGDGAGVESVGKHGQSLIPTSRKDIAGLNQPDGLDNTGVGAYADGTRGKENHWHLHREVWGRYWLEVHCSVRGTDPRFDAWKTTPQYIADLEAEKTAFDAGTWILINFWYADEHRGPVRLMYGVPWIVRDKTMISTFGFECDTSSVVENFKGPGYPLIGYWRNVCALRNYTSPGQAIGVSEDDGLIFQRPIG